MDKEPNTSSRKGQFECPACSASGRGLIRVKESFHLKGGITRRRRRCTVCAHRWWTLEGPELLFEVLNGSLQWQFLSRDKQEVLLENHLLRTQLKQRRQAFCTLLCKLRAEQDKTKRLSLTPSEGS